MDMTLHMNDDGLAADVAATIRSERAARGWSRAELQQRSGVTEQQIGRFERSERDPRVADLAAIAQALGLSLAGFFALAEESGRRRRKSAHRDAL